MARVSKQFIESVKLSPIRAYRLAQAAEVNPSVLSQIINRIIDVRAGDYRVIAVGEILGLKAEQCFEQDPSPGNRNAGGAA